MTESGDVSDDSVQQASEADSAAPTLYERLGGEDSIESVISEFYKYVMADDLVNHYFEDTDMQQQIIYQTQFISSVTGGPVEYSGEDMRAAHEGMGITKEEFDAIAGHLNTALKEFEVPEEDREDGLAEISSVDEVIPHTTRQLTAATKLLARQYTNDIGNHHPLSVQYSLDPTLVLPS